MSTLLENSTETSFIQEQFNAFAAKLLAPEAGNLSNDLDRRALLKCFNKIIAPKPLTGLKAFRTHFELFCDKNKVSIDMRNEEFGRLTENLEPKRSVTPQGFKSMLREYCEAIGLDFNPHALRGENGAIIRKRIPRNLNPDTMQWEHIPGAQPEVMEVFFIYA